MCSKFIGNLCASVLLAVLAAPTFARELGGGLVAIDVLDRHGGRFEQYPLATTHDGAERAYLQAERGARYRIRIRNTSGERIGVVIAVDGRNIISGRRSNLSPDEQMYILDPWQVQDYAGWRTSLERVHEFYFTEWGDSYAEAFGDRSAQGVIAVAAFLERRRREYRDDRWRDEHSRGQPPSQRGAHKGEASPPAVASEKAEERSAGTGFGDARYEPARRVHFEVERQVSQRIFLKYEWPQTLCDRGISCDRRYYGRRSNRFWPDASSSFAPYPPPRR
jgi:hypothetical protein